MNELMALQVEISEEKMSSYVGTELDVLIEEKLDDNTYIGRTKYDAPEVDGVFYLTSRENVINKIVKSRVTDSRTDLGEIIWLTGDKFSWPNATAHLRLFYPLLFICHTKTASACMWAQLFSLLP